MSSSRRDIRRTSPGRGRFRLEQERWLVERPREGIPRILLVFPNSYEIGMSSLSFLEVIRQFALEGARVERAFLPPREEIERQLSKGIPLFSMESRLPFSSFDLIGFSLSWELDFVNIPRMLRLAGLEPLACKRARGPVVIAGGPAVLQNIKPIAPFIDFFVAGPAETVIGPLVRWACDIKKGKTDFDSVFELKNVFLPETLIKHLDMMSPPGVVWTGSLLPARSPVITARTEFSGMFLMEVARGCRRKCRYCMVPHTMGPYVECESERVLEITSNLPEGLPVGLVGTGVSSHSELDRILEELEKAGRQVAFASLYPGDISERILYSLAKTGAPLSLGVECGSDLLRKELGKGFTNENLLELVSHAAKTGVRKFKLYFILELEENDEEASCITSLIESILEHIKRYRQDVEISLSINPLTPKPYTPFMMKKVDLARAGEKLNFINRSLAKKPQVRLTCKSMRESRLYAKIVGGDEELLMPLSGPLEHWQTTGEIISLLESE